MNRETKKRSVIQKDVVIIGAGASGLMCAIEAAKRGRSVVVLEHMGRIAGKIRVSGGGKCNFTNINLNPDNYLSGNPHFCKSALARFTPADFIRMLEEHRIRYYEKEKGELFCSTTSAEIVGMLREECRRYGVEISLNLRIAEVTKKDLFLVSTDSFDVEAISLVIATGGLSYPKLGATDLGFRIAKSFGLKVTRLKPALVPFVFEENDRNKYSLLSGVSFNANVSCRGRDFRGEVLFTHRGLSGPAILQSSNYWEEGDEIVFDLMPDMDIENILLSKRRSRVELVNFLSEHLPRRFCRTWCEWNAASKPILQYTEKELREIARKLKRWTIKPEHTEGFGKAEITRGGIDTNELSSKAMESKRVQGLYFVGEVVDVSGQLGGYNLQWAWSSGFAAGQDV